MTNKPNLIADDAARIAAIMELRAHNQWVCWGYEERNGKRTKPPLAPRSGYRASIANPEHWTDFNLAKVQARFRGSVEGVGFVLTETDPYIGIDLDKCRDPQSGVIEPWAQDVLALSETYAEISPSGAGIRLFARGSTTTLKSDPAHVEIYSSGRYLTVTGRHIEGTPAGINEAPETLKSLRARVEAIRPAEPKAQERQRHEPCAPGPKKEKAGSGSAFWRAVNDAALANRQAWVSALFPSAAYLTSSDCWRVSSKSLGRDREEDLAIHAQGIRDWGEHDMGDARAGARTPVDLVVEWGGAPDAKAAAQWLCERLGRTMEHFGWRAGRKKRVEAEPQWEDVEESGPKPEPQPEQQPANEVGAHPVFSSSNVLERDDDGTIRNPATGEIIHDPRNFDDAAEAYFPDELADGAPGLLGEIIDYLLAADPSGVACKPFALAAGLAIVGTVAGRYWFGPTLSGTHLYVAALRETGGGKNHYLTSIRHVLKSAGLEFLGGPDEFSSQTALIDHLYARPVSICPQDEIGENMQRYLGQKASSFQRDIGKSLKIMWGNSLASFAGTKSATKSHGDLFSPSLSIYGTGTPSDFWNTLKGSDLKSGFLNRFLIVPAAPEPTPEPGSWRQKRGQALHAKLLPVPQSIRDGLRAIFNGGNIASAGMTVMAPAAEITPHIVDWGEQLAQDIYLQFREWIAIDTASDRARANTYGRTAEQAVRLATIRAIGANAKAPRITALDMDWARNVALWTARCCEAGIRAHMSDSEAQGHAKDILKIVAAYGGSATRKEIGRKLNHRLRIFEVENALQSLLVSEEIKEVVSKPKGGKRGRPTKTYVMTD